MFMFFLVTPQGVEVVMSYETLVVESSRTFDVNKVVFTRIPLKADIYINATPA